jgi:hypothetical protein
MLSEISSIANYITIITTEVSFLLNMTESMASGTITSPDFDYLCRLCAAKTSVLMGLHIFEREGDSRQIFKKITACLPVQVNCINFFTNIESSKRNRGCEI